MFTLLLPYVYLAHGSEKEAQYDERDVVGRKHDGDSEHDNAILTCQEDRFATEPVCHRRKDDSADHDSEVEHRL